MKDLIRKILLEYSEDNKPKPRNYWTYDTLKKEAGKYTKRTDFIRKSPTAYQVSQDLGVYDEITTHMPKVKVWTPEELAKVASQFTNMRDFSNEAKGAYIKAHRMGILDDITKHFQSLKRKITKDNFDEFAREVHGDKYDYTKTNFTSTRNDVVVTCPIHGDFLTSPANHMRGSGCPECFGTKKRTTQEFIDSARKVHGDRYDYSQANYTHSEKPIHIICPEHGSFNQIPANHLKGDICPKCAGNQKSNTQEFISKSRLIHGDRYNYDKVEYTNNKTPVVISCPKPNHGDFVQKPNSHLSGSGCPFCSESRGEKYVSLILTELGVLFTRQAKFKDCVNYNIGKKCRRLPFDFYLPTYNSVIEFDGVQHFKEVGFWGGSKSLKSQQARDQIKNQYCEDKGIKMIRIPYTMERENIRSFITKHLGIQ